MKYNLIAVSRLYEDESLVGIMFTLKTTHPKFGSQIIKHEWRGSPGMSVQDWLDLPNNNARKGTLNAILRGPADEYWDKLEQRAGNTTPPPLEFPGLIGEEIV